MDTEFKKCLDSLSDNESEIRSDALRILLRLCDNIISFPNDHNYRRIRVDDPRIADKLLRAFGAIECLFEMGFVEDGEYFSLPPDASLSRLRQIQKALHGLQTKIQSIGSASENIPQKEKKPKMKHRDKFLNSVVDRFKHILIYENPHLQSKARRVVPLEKLQIGAMERMRELQKQMKKNKLEQNSSPLPEHQVTMEDFLLVELLDWFKNQFFTWVDSPTCSVCDKGCVYERVELSTDPRISRTEIHKCEDCGLEAKFPRYTDPGILLKTRRGRCGEWANVFTLICRTLNFDARVVHDETDHVWTEVWSIACNRWIHADPCENVMDRPLLYERGWKKKLTYVIAYSKDEVQDVTWRYTRDQASIMKRRILCSENDLCSLICKLNDERQNSLGYSKARKQFVTKRRAMELVEFMPAPPGSKKPCEDGDAEYGGRTSGSLAWRMSRGEMKQDLPKEPQIWKIPRDAKQFVIRYYSARDEYETSMDSDKSVERRKGWENGVESIKGGIFRKVESDWKMAYLARSPGQDEGRLSWCFELLQSEQRIKSFAMEAQCTTFNGAMVKWEVQGSHRDPTKPDVFISIDDCQNFRSEDLNNSSRITIIAKLSGGEGDLAWQHAQLFRQSLTNEDSASIVISMELCNEIF
ncbi:peptide-N(4)-(N-acetyl-beta-glucosaminyl)asparagine amidase [Venturia canescens]|uniref:peptide-N(4)-(N-acetyl-beta- glucosaminyl)asparagine amidase n=1 Tax=Venturia canescens TaxID=32260 RepID=UPI001C9C67B4|nr:peptide-N(4)-(N-acetyl-beta-glucosaminyl)asparagine amidase [Venturia canescens]